MVLIVPDKFKGTLTAGDAAEAIANGWSRRRPGDALDLLPMSDGGDGFGEVISRLLHAKVQCLEAIDAAHRPRKAHWWWEAESKTAVIETANVIGLAMLPPGKFHPFELDTFGLGTLFRAAEKHAAKSCLVGIGGSATNDGGFGLARSLGWEFLDRMGAPIERWTDLERLAMIRALQGRHWPKDLVVAVDVQNVLLGARGATRVYGPQKGLRKQRDFELAERCLRRLALVVKKSLGHDLARETGTGAAGGLGFGLCAFLGAQLVPGFELFSRLAGLERRLRSADLVITGEGAIDNSTLMGKGVGQIARQCRQLKLPCIGLAGTISAGTQTHRLFTQTHALTALTSLSRAKAKPAHFLERLAASVAGAL